MGYPSFLFDVLGWRRGDDKPNIADADSATSVAIAAEVLRHLGVERHVSGKENVGIALENGVKDYFASELPSVEPNRHWVVERNQPVYKFRQYAHLARLQELIEADKTGTLRTEIGADYVIKPDVTVAVRRSLSSDVTGEMGSRDSAAPLLHAAVSCKWTIRSDRVQNIRHEAVILTRHRRGRQPHIVTVTAEPLPSRLAAIARGTGEVDAVYHVALVALTSATTTAGTSQQIQTLDELVEQDRLKDLRDLPHVLSV